CWRCTPSFPTRRSSDHFVNVSLAENTILGTIITKFSASDADQNGHAPVLYSLDGETNRRRFFEINSEGFVRLNRALDRETTPTRSEEHTSELQSRFDLV